MDKITNKKIKKISDLIAESCKPQKIILFGSFAWGKPTKDSDVDLMIIKQIRKNKRQAQINLARLLFGQGVPVDTLIYTPREIKKRLELKDFFIQDIFKKGKILYEKK